MPVETKTTCILRCFISDSIVLIKDQVVKNVYFICSGSVRAVNEFGNGRLFSIATIGPMNFLGELEILSGESNCVYTVEAITDCTIIQIPKDGFLKWLDCDHNFAMNTVKRIAKKMYNSAYRNSEVLSYSTIYLLTSFIIGLIKQKANSEENAVIDKNREQIAAELGVSVRTINRNIRKLKEEKLITIKQGKVFINNAQYSRLLKKMDELRWV